MPQILNILTFNLRCNVPGDGANAWPYRKEMAARVFADHQVDIAGLQEAQAGQIEDLQSRLRGYAWIGVGRSDGESGGEFSPIFYDKRKFAVEKHGTFWLSETPAIAGSKSWDASLPRIATWGIFHDQASGNRLFFLNTHFDHLGEQAREKSARLLLRQILGLHEGLPVILAGDFNCTPDSLPIKRLVSDPGLPLADARQASATPHVGGNGSFNGFKTDGPDRIIDFVFVGPGTRVQSHGYYPTMQNGVFISDHWPVVSSLVCWS